MGAQKLTPLIAVYFCILPVLNKNRFVEFSILFERFLVSLNTIVTSAVPNDVYCSSNLDPKIFRTQINVDPIETHYCKVL